MELLAIESKVKYYLETFPACRDDDNKLISFFWYYFVGEDKIKSMSAMDMLNWYKEGKLPKPVTIVRARRRIQVLNIELRGKNYDGNQGAQGKVKDQLKKFGT